MWRKTSWKQKTHLQVLQTQMVMTRKMVRMRMRLKGTMALAWMIAMIAIDAFAVRRELENITRFCVRRIVRTLFMSDL